MKWRKMGINDFKEERSLLASDPPREL